MGKEAICHKVNSRMLCWGTLGIIYTFILFQHKLQVNMICCTSNHNKSNYYNIFFNKMGKDKDKIQHASPNGTGQYLLQ